ncbi:MAG: sensor histidine kinase [Methylococcaceae bacterium]|nr:sensor histidine kinase [Methylococcaceae bacterium]
MTSLRQRLSRGLVLILCIVFVLHWFAADWVIRAVAEKQMATRLNDDGYSLMETLSSEDNGQLRFNSFHISSVYQRAFSGHYYVVQVDGKATASPSLQNHRLNLTPIGPNQAMLYHLNNGPQQQPLLVLGQGTVKFGHKIVISVAEDLSAVDHDITAIRFAYLNLTLIILGCAIALQRYDVNRALKPLTQVGQELETITTGQQQQITVDVPTEIKPLVKEVNRLLVLVVRRLQQSRTAIGNLAHALKSPLAMMFRVAEHPVFNEYPELRQQLQTQTDTIHRCIERELKRARIAGNSQNNAAFNLQVELTALVQLLQNIYAHRSLSIQVNAPDTLIPFDREDMLEMIGNLMDNACKWAVQQVRIEVTFADTLTITVADDGAGCDTLDAQDLIQRGVRLDESIQGHGLGLAIVADIVEFYAGTLQFGRSRVLGGFWVSVRLPLH